MHKPTCDRIDDLRRELDQLAERRLLAPLNEAEMQRYLELCEAEYDRLGRPSWSFESVAR